MILRRLATAIREQNWFTVIIEILIVVLGVFIGLQVQQYAVEQDRKASEEQYLGRLRSEVEQLIVTRLYYDKTRKSDSAELRRAVKILNGDDNISEFTPELCLAIVNSSFTTVAPFGLPTATELLSAGRLDQISSPNVRKAILALIQDAERARDLTVIISGTVTDLGRTYPDLIKTRMIEAVDGDDQVRLTATCNTAGLRNNPAFMNDLNSNAQGYIVYAERGVLPVSQKLIELREILDAESDIHHSENQEPNS